jgi:hypothetical protein
MSDTHLEIEALSDDEIDYTDIPKLAEDVVLMPTSLAKMRAEFLHHKKSNGTAPAGRTPGGPVKPSTTTPANSVSGFSGSDVQEVEEGKETLIPTPKKGDRPSPGAVQPSEKDGSVHHEATISIPLQKDEAEDQAHLEWMRAAVAEAEAIPKSEWIEGSVAFAKTRKYLNELIKLDAEHKKETNGQI